MSSMSVTAGPLELESMCLATETSRFGTPFGGNGTAAEGRSLTTTILVSILSSLLSLMIVVGNGLIIVSVAIVKKLRQPANYLIVSLALSDFLVGVIVLPLTIVYDIEHGWILGSMMCDVHVSFDVICCSASIMNLCMISIDRYFIITKPMTYPQRRNGKLMAVLIATAWLMSCLIIIPALFGFTENVKDGPDWLRLSYNAVIEESGRRHVRTNSNQNASAAIDNNSTTFWEPGKVLNKPDIWYFTLDLGHSYKVTNVRLQNAGDNIHDVLQYNIQAYSCKDDPKVMIEKSIYVKGGTDEIQEENIGEIAQARYLR